VGEPTLEEAYLRQKRRVVRQSRIESVRIIEFASPESVGSDRSAKKSRDTLTVRDARRHCSGWLETTGRHSRLKLREVQGIEIR